MLHTICYLNVGRFVPAIMTALIVAWSNSADAQGLELVKANYTKFEYRIPMRDGKRLFTAVYVPKDVSKTYPMLMTRSPYSAKPYGVDQYRNDLGPSALFGKAGYIFVYQDVRGRWMSEGTHIEHAAASSGQNGTDRHR